MWTFYLETCLSRIEEKGSRKLTEKVTNLFIEMKKNVKKYE